MTAQIPERFSYDGRNWELTRATNWKQLFHPSDWGIYATGMLHTGCMRGYIVKYAVDNGKRLVLNGLTVNVGERVVDSDGRETVIAPDKIPTLNGVAPSLSENGLASYDSVGLQLKYTGSILIGANFGFYSRRYNPPYIDQAFLEKFNYEEMWELDFENGVLLSAVDRSSESEAARLMQLLRRPAILVEPISKSLKNWRWAEERERLLLNGIEVVEGIDRWNYFLVFSNRKWAEVFEVDRDKKTLEFLDDETALEFLNDKEKHKLLGCKVCGFSNDIEKLWEENREFRELLNAFKSYKESSKLESDGELARILAKKRDDEDGKYLTDQSFCEWKIFKKAIALAFGDDFFAKWYKR